MHISRHSTITSACQLIFAGIPLLSDNESICCGQLGFSLHASHLPLKSQRKHKQILVLAMAEAGEDSRKLQDALRPVVDTSAWSISFYCS